MTLEALANRIADPPIANQYSGKVPIESEPDITLQLKLVNEITTNSLPRNGSLRSLEVSSLLV